MAVVIALRNRHKTEVVIHTCIVLCPFKIALLSHNKRDNRNRFLGTEELQGLVPVCQSMYSTDLIIVL